MTGYWGNYNKIFIQMQAQVFITKNVLTSDFAAVVEDLSEYKLSDLNKKLNQKINSVQKPFCFLNLKCDNTIKIAIVSIFKGTSLNSFQAGKAVILNIFGGVLNLSSSNKVKRLGKNDVAVLTENVKFNLTAVNDCIFVITSIRNNSNSKDIVAQISNK